MAKLSKAYGINDDLANAGVWFEFGEGEDKFRLKIRYINSQAFAEVQARVADEYPVPARRRNPEDQLKITKLAAAKGLLMEWEGLTDDAGRPLPDTWQARLDAFNESHEFYLDVLNRASQAYRFEGPVDQEDQEGNSSRASGTTSKAGGESSPTPFLTARRETA